MTNSKDWYQNNPGKRKEHYDTWKDKFSIEELREMSREAANKFRESHPEQWREYQNSYWREYLKDPINKFAHGVRTSLHAKIKTTKKYQDALKNDQNVDHIIPVIVMTKFFNSRGYIVLEDKQWTSTLRSVVNSTKNYRFIKKSSNTKINHASLERQLKVAGYFESQYPFICKGLIDFIKGFNQNE